MLRARKVGAAVQSARFRSAAQAGVFPSLELRSLLPVETIRTVIDVGANRGQFALLALDKYSEANVICFEPGPTAYSVLSEIMSDEPDVSLHQLALGENAGSVSLLVSQDDDSSSLFAPTDAQLKAAPGSATDRVENVRQARADSLLSGDALEGLTLLKIDVQGAELSVLKGFGSILDQIDFVLLELSLVELYEGQDLSSSVIAWLDSRGFELCRVGSATVSNGAQLQFDALFRRRGNQ